MELEDENEESIDLGVDPLACVLAIGSVLLERKFKSFGTVRGDIESSLGLVNNLDLLGSLARSIHID